MSQPQVRAVPVPGGNLSANYWRRGGPLVLAVHGITSNGLAWAGVADELADHDVLAPDLRGRGLSGSLPGPYGLARHADDVVALLDAFGVREPVVLAGHSMGAFVACLAAVRHPGRFSRLVLVDGGLGFAAPAGADLDAVLTAVLGPAMQRLAREFASAEEYHDYWRAHPAFTGLWDDRVAAHLDRDLVGEPPHLRSSCAVDAVRTDGGQVLADPDALAAIHRLPVPATLLWAEGGLLGQVPGLYTDQTIAAAALPASVAVRQVPDVNHYSILLGGPGAKAVADAIRADRTR